MEGDHYSPSQAARILSRSGRSIPERRIRQMLQAGELEGEQTETGRWQIPQSVVHALLEQRREQEQLRGGPEKPLEASESVRELMARVEAYPPASWGAQKPVWSLRSRRRAPCETSGTGSRRN